MRNAYTFLQSIVFVFFWVVFVQAKPLKDGWRTGQLTQWNNIILTGELAYNWSAEVVMLRQTNGCIRTFSAHQVRDFSWFDSGQSRHRYFISLDGAVGKDRAGQHFYEIYLEGFLPVVRRLKRPHGIFKRVLDRPIYYTDTQTLAQNPDHFDYFVYNDGRLLALDRFYPDIYEPHLAVYDRELKRYIGIHNINERSLLGRLVLIDHYNFITRQAQKSASARTATNLPN